MGNLFGVRRRAPVVTAQDRAILQLKQQRDKIKIYQKRTESDLEKNKELALKLFQNGMKDRALIVMRRKKYMEDILSRTDKQLETLEALVNDIEYTQIEVSVVEGLKVGTEALKQLTSLMNVDDIQQMMEESEEAAEKQREITDILQRSSERYDEDELLKELEKYQEPVQKQPQPQTPEQKLPEQEEKQTDQVQADVAKEPDVAVAAPPVEQKLDDLPAVPENIPHVPSKEKEEGEEDKVKEGKKEKKRELELAQ